MTDEALSTRERLDLRVGAIVREGASLDAAARRLLASLRGEERALPSSLNGTLLECRDRIPHAGLGDRMVDALSAIDASAEAYRERNRYAHDMLLESEDDKWLRARFDRGTVKIEDLITIGTEDFQTCRDALIAAGWRLWALRSLVEDVRDGRPFSHHLGTIIRGDIEIDENGDASW